MVDGERQSGHTGRVACLYVLISIIAKCRPIKLHQMGMDCKLKMEQCFALYGDPFNAELFKQFGSSSDL